MPLFKFQALHAGGQKTTGVIEADSLISAKDRLRLQQMMITEIIPYAETKRKPSISRAQQLSITRMIGQLLNAGVPLYETLVILEEKYKKMPFHPLLVDLCDNVKKGESLSRALASYPTLFDPIYIAMVKAGEESGELKASFEELTHLLENKNRFKKKIVASTAYPLFLGTFCIIVFVSLLIWVIPSLKNLFEGRSLHPLTQTVFALSDLFLAHVPLITLITLILFLLALLGLTHPKLKPHWDCLLLRFPIIGPLILLASTTRFCKTASLLLKGGTPLLQTLELSRSVLKNQTLQNAARAAEKEVSEGSLLSLQAGWMPPLAPRMLSIGEKTGQIGPMFSHIAALCEEDLSRSLERYTALLQPILLLILGLLIGTVVLSILIPLTDVGSVL